MLSKLGSLPRNKMRLKMRQFRWTKTKAKAAQLFAAGDLVSAEIASRCKVDPATLFRWKKHPSFIRKLAQYVSRYESDILDQGIALKRKRVQILNTQCYRLLKLIDDRAEDVAMQGTPGGTTGLLVKETRTVYAGKNTIVTERFDVDPIPIREIREHLKQVAQELGQWEQKLELTTPAPVAGGNVSATVEMTPEFAAQTLGYIVQHTIRPESASDDAEQASQVVST